MEYAERPSAARLFRYGDVTYARFARKAGGLYVYIIAPFGREGSGPPAFAREARIGNIPVPKQPRGAKRRSVYMYLKPLFGWEASGSDDA